MTLLKLKRILAALKDRIRLINLKFLDSKIVQITYDTGKYYCLRMSLNLENTGCQDFSCNVQDIVHALDCFNSNRCNSIRLDSNKFYSGDKSVEITIDKPLNHQFIQVSYTNKHNTSQLLECLNFVTPVSSDSLPKFEWLQFITGGWVQGSCGYAIHEYQLQDFVSEFSAHRDGVYQLIDLLQELEEYDILNPSEYIDGGSWKDGYAFKGSDSDFIFEIILITQNNTPYVVKNTYPHTFKVNKSDLHDMCVQATKSKSDYIEFSPDVGTLAYKFSSKQRGLKLTGSMPAIGSIIPFKVASSLLYNSIAEGRIIEVSYLDSRNPFLFVTGGKFRAYIAPMV